MPDFGRVLVLSLAALSACGAPPAGEALPLGDDAAACGSCHEDHHEEWRDSPHGQSARSPVLLAMLPEVESAWGAAARDTCVGCHAPEHSADDPSEGIGCVSCHAAVGNHAERDGELAIDRAAPLAGTLSDAEASPAHRTAPRAFLGAPSLCGTCHEITGPELVDEPTLREYRASPQAAEGRTCADCHLPEVAPRALSNDSSGLRASRSHRFVGFDPPWGASPEEAEASAARTRDLLDDALDLSLERTDAGVRVSVANVGAGHSVPTGAAFLRDLWVDLERDGEVVAARVITLGDQPMRGDAQVALLTRADRVVTGSLAAGTARSVELDAGEGPVRAVLRGRAVREAVLEALDQRALGAQLPTHVIAEAELR